MTKAPRRRRLPRRRAADARTHAWWRGLLRAVGGAAASGPAGLKRTNRVFSGVRVASAARANERARRCVSPPPPSHSARRATRRTTATATAPAKTRCETTAKRPACSLLRDAVSGTARPFLPSLLRARAATRSCACAPPVRHNTSHARRRARGAQLASHVDAPLLGDDYTIVRPPAAWLSVPVPLDSLVELARCADLACACVRILVSDARSTHARAAAQVEAAADGSSSSSSSSSAATPTRIIDKAAAAAKHHAAAAADAEAAAQDEDAGAWTVVERC